MNPIIKRMCILFIILSLAGLPTVTVGGETEKGYKARVRLSVIAAEKVSGLISSFMTIDLRKLGDVVITDMDPDWHLAVTGVELHADGKRTGVAVSTVIMAPVREADAKSIITVLEKEGSLPAALQKFKSKQLVEVKSSWLRADADTALRELCRGIIADFDAEYLQPGRKNVQHRNQ
ncbi:MAG: hypothetical protein P1P89_01420 [Desulfobacterales bacterium]|nr:hypothetical protein [Desulfobacterales bacterium]